MSSGLLGILKSSVLRKQIVAVTGLMLVCFVVSHMAGNMLFFLGHNTFNEYAEHLQALGKLLWVARLGLVSAFLVHICLTVMLFLENWKARPQAYAVNRPVGDRSFSTKTMIITGSVIFLFVLYHLWDFTIGPERTPEHTFLNVPEGMCIHLFGYVWRSFEAPLRAAVYIIGMSCVGLHLLHAIGSMFQTIGFNHDKYTLIINKLSIVVGAVVALAFAFIPIYVMLMHYVKGTSIVDKL